MVHVEQYTSGDFFRREKQQGTAIATFIAEYEAVQWNLRQLEIVNYEGARKQWEDYLIDVITEVLGESP